MSFSKLALNSTRCHGLFEVGAATCAAVFVHPAVVFGFYSKTRKGLLYMLLFTLWWALFQLSLAGPLHPYGDVTLSTLLQDLADFLFLGLMFFLSGLLLRHFNRWTPTDPAIISPGNGPIAIILFALMLAASAHVLQKQAADYRASLVETRAANLESAMGLYKAWNEMRQKEAADSPSLLALQYEMHKATYRMLDEEPFGTIEAYKANLEAKRAMIESAAAESRKSEAPRAN